MERRLRIPEGDGGRLLIALGIGLIGCLPQIIDLIRDTTGRLADAGHALGVRIGGLSLRLGRDA